MLLNFFQEKHFTKYNSIIVIPSVFAFSIYFLIELFIFGVNFPRADDWSAVFAAIYFQQNDPVWVDAIFDVGNEHLLFSYRLLMMSIFLLNSYNVFHITILNWGLLTASILVFYYILKRTDSRLVWLLIPISAFVFNPKIIHGSIVGSVGLVWNLTFFLNVLTIAILTKEKISNYWFLLAIFAAITASFTSALGHLSWIAGIILLSKNLRKNKNHLIIWTLLFLSISFLFYTLTSANSLSPDQSSILTLDRILYSLEYVVNPFTLTPDGAKHLVGLLIVLSIVCLSAFMIIKKITISWPWVTLSVMGILFTLLTTLGRFDVRPPHQSYFIIMSTATEIGILVLFSILYLESRNLKNNYLKKTVKIIFIIFIILQIGLLGATYVYYLDKIHEGPTEDLKLQLSSCFDLPTIDSVHSCSSYHMMGDPSRSSSHDELLSMINFFIINKMAIFSDNGFFEEKQFERSLLINNVNSITNIFDVDGDIQTLNGEFVENNSKIFLKENFVTLNGWIKSDFNEITSLILFVDDTPFLSSNLLSMNTDILENISDDMLFWEISFFPAYLENGCHTLSVQGMNDDALFVVNKNLILCVESSKNYPPGELNPSTFKDTKNKIFSKLGIN
ncbi:hypothetical protein [Nitrosopumilus sp.]|uniref:hypothetical protein n=1 Tax=Nitrosopumilus sp. TaxID=2024843 RepID=UPI003D0D1EE7